MTPPKSPKQASPETPERFEDAVAELEQIVAAMEAGTLSLEDSLARFQRGTVLLRHCRTALESAEKKIRVLQDGELNELAADTDSN